VLAAMTGGGAARSLAAFTLAATVATVLPPLAAAEDRDTVSRDDAPLVAAASDLKFALDEVVAAFGRETGIAVRVTYGSSGNLARQIAQGAPYGLFLSADESFVHDLSDRGLTRDRGALYAIGRIALFAPNDSPLVPDSSLANLARRLRDGSSGLIAIANPEHAPYGRAAEDALRKLGLWESILPRLVLGENVAQAAQFAASGNADGGIIAYSLALAPPLRERGRYALLPEQLHAPLRQRMVLTSRASPGALRLYEYLQAPAARAILERHGFVLPTE
jgi:molybdate transport system substrate-binding protein